LKYFRLSVYWDESCRLSFSTRRPLDRSWVQVITGAGLFPSPKSTSVIGGQQMQIRLLSIGGKSLVGFLCLLLLAGCYYYRAQGPGAAGRGVTDYEGEVVWSLAWGLVQTNPRVANCQGQALAEVRTTNNFGYVLLTVVTLGFVSPQRVDWRCASPTPSEGGLRVPSR
jgi:hypothetical protein